MALSVDRESNGGCESCDALHLVASLAQVWLRTRLEKRNCLLEQLLNFTDAFVHAETRECESRAAGSGSTFDALTTIHMTSNIRALI